MLAQTTCPTAQQLAALLNSGPITPEMETLLNHLETCESCAHRLTPEVAVDELIGVIRKARSLVQAPIPETVVQLMERISQAPPSTLDTGQETINPTPSAGGSPESDGWYSFLAPAQSADELGRLGPFRVLELLGQGGMGMVFRAEDLMLKRQVALKVMKPNLNANPQNRERFLREAQAAAGLHHDNIVPIHQVGEANGVPFLAMPLLQGMSLEDRLRKTGSLPVPQVLRLGRQIALGLAAAHERGLVHRDIKPGNLWLEPEQGGRIKILDFGLARAREQEQGITQSGVLLGTPTYMAPEQGRGEKIDGRADLWSLGVVLYRLCTGELPFKGPDTMSTLLAIAMNEPKPVGKLNANLPPELAGLVMKLLEKDPNKRPQTAQEVVKTITGIEKDLAAKALRTAQTVEVPPESKPAELVKKPAPPLPVASPNRKSRKPVFVLAGLAAAAAVVVLAGIVMYLLTPDGVVRIEINDPNIKVSIIENKVVFKDVDREEISLTSGEYGLRIKRGDLEFDTKDFTIRKGDKISLKVEFLAGKVQVVQGDRVIGEKALVPPPPPPPPTDFALLFDGNKNPKFQLPLTLDISQPFTVEAWFTVDGREGSAPRAIAGSSGPSAILGSGRFNLLAGKQFGFNLRGQHSNGHFMLFSPAIFGKKTHVACVFTGKEMLLFVQGKLVQSKNVENGLPPKFLANLQLGNFYSGLIDELRASQMARYDKDFTPEKRFEPDKDTLALYHFDEGQGDVLKDSSSNGHDGKIEGATWVKADGSPVGPSANPAPALGDFALRFDGKKDQKCPLPLTLDLSQPFTVEAWLTVYGQEVVGSPCPIMVPGKFNMVAGRELGFKLKGRDILFRSLSCPPNFREKNHVACVFTGKEMHLFVQGKLVQSKNVEDNLPGKLLGQLELGYFYSGLLDEMRVSQMARYDKDFTPEKRSPPDKDTLALYHFDEGQGDVLHDSSDNGHHGKIEGARWVKADGSLVGPPAVVVTVPADVRDFAGHKYKFFLQSMNWKEARAECERLGGHLAVIDSMEKQTFLHQLLQEAKGTDAWLGASDEVKEGTWVWVTGKPMDFQHWSPGQPNNNGAQEHYLLMVNQLGHAGKWSDNPLDAKSGHRPGFFCEWESSSAPQ